MTLAQLEAHILKIMPNKPKYSIKTEPCLVHINFEEWVPTDVRIELDRYLRSFLPHYLELLITVITPRDGVCACGIDRRDCTYHGGAL